MQTYSDSVKKMLENLYSLEHKAREEQRFSEAESIKKQAENLEKIINGAKNEK